jgi:diguanylate cyclase
MSAGQVDISDLHWMMDMLQSLDVGLVVLDREYRVQVWNRFMENHSGCRPNAVIGNNIFDLCGDMPKSWFRRKAESVFLLKSRAFTTWEQRPYLFKFKNYRPITGPADFMYQNVTFIPLVSADGEVHHVGLIIYDVTDTAVSKMELQAANSQLEALSRTDRLTELNNRGYWEECLAREFQRSKRTGERCSLIMFDIDHFKKINDNYGHPAGDEVIRQTAATLRGTMRSTDVAGRYGGEEFGVILIGTQADQATVFAERLRNGIEALTVRYEDQVIRYTVSLGVARIPDDAQDYKTWIERADKALYESKRAGRNRVTVFRGI